MRRPRPIPFAAMLLIAATSGCASLAPEPPQALTAAPAPAAAPEPAAVAEAVPQPKAAPGASSTGRPAAPRATARSGAAAASTKAGASREPRARAPVPSAGGGAGTVAARDDAAASDSSAGPSVSTFVFSDAPVPVRRGAARGEAPPPTPSAARPPEGFNPYRIAYAPGTYQCELGRSVQVRTVAADLRSTVVRWGEGDYTMRSVDALSGALRYEDATSGLAWIVLKDRAMLLDTRAGQRLANACRTRAASGRNGA